MGLLRDTGAALTMGLSATTKHKEAEKRYHTRLSRHQQTVEQFDRVNQTACAAVDEVAYQYLSAKDVLINIGAIQIDESGSVRYGWYQPYEPVQTEPENPEAMKSVIGSLPGLGTAIGAPAAVWTLVGALGTAGTGVAISSLSGAAAGAATAAWIGRAATFGLGGMTAGRVALGPIALVSLPIQGAIGAKIAGNRERNAIRNYAEAEQKMNKMDTAINRFSPEVAQCEQQARQIATNMIRHIGQCETSEPSSEPAREAVGRLILDMNQAEDLIREFARVQGEMKSACSD